MGALIGILMTFLAEVFSKVFFRATFKIALTLAFIALFVAVIYAYVSGYSAIITALGQTVPEIVTGVWGWVMPPNTYSCIFYLFSAVLLRFVTTQFIKILSWKFDAAISH